MATKSRGRTLDFDPNRHFVSRSITVETIFGIHCAGVQRSDDLLLIRRTEESRHSDGASSVDIHQDCFCSDLQNCNHVVLRTEYEHKESKYSSCKHHRELITSVVRKLKVWEGKREVTSDPYLSMEVPEEIAECHECEVERLGLKRYPPLQIKGRNVSSSRVEEIFKRFARLNENRPKGSKTLRDFHKWVTGNDDQRVPWLRADLLRSRRFSQFESRKIVKLHFETGNCTSPANRKQESHEERTETATFYDGVKSMDIHSDYFCLGREQDCFHLNLNVRKVVKTVQYRYCAIHKTNVAFMKQCEEESKDCFTGKITKGIPKTPTSASCPRCRKEIKSTAEHCRSRRKKRSRKQHTQAEANRRMKANRKSVQTGR